MTASPPSMRELAAAFTRIGFLSFGGPAGQIALMHRVVVDEKKWMDEPTYLNALNFCMLLPGPEAMQLAAYVGWRLHGLKGALATGLLFILPGAAVIVALSALYVSAGHVPLVAGVLFGLKAAVLALVIEALLRVSKRALKSRAHLAVAAAAFIALAGLSVPFPAVILAAGLAGWFLFAGAPATTETRSISIARLMRVLLLGIVLWFAPLVPIMLLGGRDGVFADLALFFSQTAVVTFGGAYAVLAHVGDVAVRDFNWLQPAEMITGLGLAETTPGPLILVLVFVGFLAGARDGVLAPMTGGLAGALVTLWFTFVPSFVFVLAGAPFIERIRAMPRLAGALQGITAAVVGVIASLGLWFAVAIFFKEGAMPALDLPFSIDWAAVVLAVASGVALLRLHVGLGWVLAGAALAGGALTAAGLA